MEPSKDQRAAIGKVRDWWGNGDRQVFRLFGPAGTGKTTLGVALPRILRADTAFYAAYTGKAAHVMRRKGCGGARTLHSLIYKPRLELRERLGELRQQLRRSPGDPHIEHEIEVIEQELESNGWILNKESDLRSADLLIVDEVSMVYKKMAEDIESFGTRMLVLGDPYQLPPVNNSAGYYTKAEPDYLLTRIHRQARDSVVLDWATRVRMGDELPSERRDGSSTIGRLPWSEVRGSFDQIIGGTNRFRWQQIRAIRKRLGFPRDLPTRGDKVIVLQNNPNLDVFNGQMFEVLKCRILDDSTLYLTVRGEDGRKSVIPTWREGFLGLDEEEWVKDKWDRNRAVMTYGWVITCHKAQGSEWDGVVVIDEPYYKREDPQWLYTAITRASKRVAIRSV